MRRGISFTGFHHAFEKKTLMYGVLIAQQHTIVAFENDVGIKDNADHANRKLGKDGFDFLVGNLFYFFLNNGRLDGLDGENLCFLNDRFYGILYGLRGIFGNLRLTNGLLRGIFFIRNKKLRGRMERMQLAKTIFTS